MNDVLAQLAEANPVRLEDVGAASFAGVALGVHRRRRRLVLTLAAAALAAVVAVSIAGHGFGSPAAVQTGPTGQLGPPSPTIDHPLVGGARKVSLAIAAAALGAPIVLPDTASVSPSDVGAVWLVLSPSEGGDDGEVDVAVTFPKQRFWVDYKRQTPSIEYGNTLALFEEFAHSGSQDGHVALMSGMPAFVNRGVDLVAGGTTIFVTGRADRMALVSAAESIARRSATPPAGQLGDVGGVQLYPYVPPARRVALSRASETLGAPVVLPDARMVKPRDAAQAWAGGTCPHPHAGGYWISNPNRRRGCWLWISFRGRPLSVGYVRSEIYGDTRGELTLLSRRLSGSTVIDLSGVPALLVPESGQFPGWVEFDVAGSQIVVAGDYDAATLRALAKSIVDRTPTPTEHEIRLSGVVQPRKRISLSRARRVFGAPIVLPKTHLGGPARVTEVWEEGTCSQGTRRSASCSIWVKMPSLTLVYGSPVWPRTRAQYEIEAGHMNRVRHQAEVIDLNGVPALAINANIHGQHNPGSIYFVVAGTRVVIAGAYDIRTLRPVAQSIVERSRAK